MARFTDCVPSTRFVVGTLRLDLRRQAGRIEAYSGVKSMPPGAARGKQSAWDGMGWDEMGWDGMG